MSFAHTRSSPPPTPFVSFDHRRKLRRAATLIREIEAACDGWEESGGYRGFVGEPDKEGMAPTLIEQLKPLPDDLSVLIGETFQCLRNSLDNLAFTLALENNDGSLNEEEEASVAFPIPRKKGKTITPGNPALALMSDAVKDEICKLNPDPPTRPSERNPLYLLNKAANRDKHRALLAAFGACSGFGMNWGGRHTGSPLDGIYAPGTRRRASDPWLSQCLFPCARQTTHKDADSVR